MSRNQSSTDNDGLWLFGYGSLIWKPPPHFDKRVPGYIEGYVRRFWQISQDHRGTPEAPGRVVTLITREHWESLTDHHPHAPSRVWGAAYHIPPSHVDEVKTYLDIREINGYTIDMAAFHVPVHVPSLPPTLPNPTSTSALYTNSAPSNSTHGSHKDQNGEKKGNEAVPAPAPITCLVYIGLPSNPQFIGPQDPQKLAEHIVRSRGPSGENKEYVYMLEAALEGIRRDVGMDEDMEIDEHVVDLARRVRGVEGRGGEDECKGEGERHGEGDGKKELGK